MRLWILIIVLLGLNYSLDAQKAQPQSAFYISTNFVPPQTLCKYDTLKLEAYLNDTSYKHPVFRWESKMGNHDWLIEQIDTARKWQISPLIPGKMYRCVIDDSIHTEALTFRKKASDIIAPIVLPFPDIVLVPKHTTCLLANGKIELRTQSDIRYLKFFWTNNSNQQHITETPAGPYSVSVLDTKTGCRKTFTDTIFNQFVPPSLFINTRYAECGLNNGAIDLSVAGNDGPFTYKWSTGAETEDLQNVGVGTYQVTVSNSVGCVTSEKMGISNIASPFRIHLHPQTATCKKANGLIACQVEGSGAPFQYLWSNGEKKDTIHKCPSGEYFVAVTNQYGCIDTAYTSVKDNCKQIDSMVLSHHVVEKLYIPNFITPNTDEKNDDFYIKGENIEKIEIVIQDTMGNVIYEDSYSEIHWDASDCGNADCIEGLYRYSANIYYKDGNMQEKKGSFWVQK